MKKSLLAILAILSAHFIFAQDDFNFIRKTNWMVGGRGMFSSQSQDQDPYEIKRTSFSLSPNVGYFAWDKVALGARFSYDTEKLDINNNETKQTDYMIMPWARYYFLPPAKDVNIFADLSYGFGSSKFDDDEAESVNKYGIEAGVAWFCNPRVAVEFSGGYRSTKYETEDNRANTIFFAVGFQIHLQRCGDEKLTVQPKENFRGSN